jgi:hypothetical protein
MTPHLLPPAEYWRLRYLQAVAERAEALADAVALRAAAQAAQAQQMFREALALSAAQHGYEATMAYTWDDARCALLPPFSAAPAAITPVTTTTPALAATPPRHE